MSAPPPYDQEADTQDLVTEIKNLSEQTLKVDKKFEEVQTSLERDGRMGPELRGKWRDIHKVYTDLLWTARRAATEVGSYNRDFVDVIIPTVAEPSESIPDKIAELNAFINKSPPKLLTETETTDKIKQLKAAITDFANEHYQHGQDLIASENEQIAQFRVELEKQNEKVEKAKHSGGIGRVLGLTRPPHIDIVKYDFKIEQARSNIAALDEQQNDVRDGTRSVAESLEGIAERVGKCFATVWTHVNKGARDIKDRLEATSATPTPDVSATARMYGSIKETLRYYATNVSKS